MSTDMQLRIHGHVSNCICRTTTEGKAMLEILLTTPSGQEVHAKHTYPDASAASSYAAMSLASKLKGQSAELYTTNPRFTWRRLDCIALHVHPTSSTPARKDLE